MRYVIGLVSLLVTPFYIWAAGETAQTITVDGTIYDSTNYTNPLLDSNVLLTIQILDPTKACILYEEQQTVDTSTTNGQFNIQVGSEPGNAKRVAVNDPNHDMATILQNVTPMSTDVGCAGTYTPAARDERYLRITVDPTVGGPETMVPDLTISAVPNALVAESVQGLDKNKIAEFGTHIHANMTPTNLLNLFDGSDVGGGLHNHDALYARLNASSSITLGLQETVGLGQFTTAQQTTLTGGLNGTTDVGKMWVNSTTNKVMYWDGTQAVDVAQVGGDFQSDGSVPMSGALNLNGQNAINSGHITMNAQMYIQLGRFDNTQEAALAATPLTVAHKGVTIFNTDSNVMKYWDGAAFITVGGGTMNDVVDDTTPQLGGNLDLNSNSLTSAAAFPITTGSSAGHDLTVNTNQLVVEGDTGRVGIGTATPSQALDVVGNIAVSGTVDGIDIATDVAANTAKVTNATHTGDVTGSGALAIDPSAISGKTTVTAVATDMVLLWDATDSQLKKADVNDFISGGGSMNDVVDDTTPQLGGNLDVNGNNFTSAAGMDFAIGGAAGNDFTVDTNKLVVEGDTGNVGIGTAAPTSALDLNGAMTVQEISAPAVSASGDGRIYFDSTAKKFRVSENGGAYTDLLGGGGITDVISDATPQLGGQLDVNGQALGDGTLELMTFSETASAVNQLNVTNAATGNGPTLSAAGDDTNIDLVLDGKGTGQVVLSSSDLNVTGNIVVSGTVDGIDIATDVAANTAKVTNATHTGDVTGSGALAIDPSAISGKTTVTAVATDMVLLWDATDSQLKKADVNDFIGGGGSMNDLVDDTTPQLGGNLDLNSNSLTSAAAFPITTGSSAGHDLTVNTNQLVVEGDTGRVGIGTATPSQALDVVGNIAVSGTVDGIDIATDVAANTAKVTNATHTGDVTGSGALTIAPSAISGKTTVTAVATDMVLLWDATDSQLKKADVNDFIGGGGSMNDVVDDTTPQLGGNLDVNGNNFTSAAGMDFAIGGSAGNDFTVDTNKLVVEGDTGNVAIGATAPLANFTVSDNASFSANINLSTGPRVEFGTNLDPDQYLEFGSYGSINNLDTKGRDLSIFSAAAANAIFLEESNGNIGLSTGTPTSRLDINGALNMQEISAPAVSASGDGRIYFDSTAKKFRVSENGGAYTDLLGGGGITDVISDATPQLGGQLDVNGQALGDGTLELMTFSETASAVNQLNVTNAATGNGPTLSAAGDDTNIDLVLDGKGTGQVVLSSSDLNVTGNIVVSGTVDGIDIATDVAANTAKVTNATHTGDVTGSGALAIDPSAISGKTTVTAVATDMVLLWDATDSQLKKADVNDFMGAGGSMNDVVDDTTPQLGGNLDLNSNSLTSAAAFPITTGSSAGHDLTVNTNQLVVEGDTGRVGIGTATPSQALDVVGNIAVSGTVDGIDIATDVAANTAKVTNATHTGDVTGSGALTIDPSAISGKTTVTAVATDMVLLWDATDSQLKKADVNDFIGGGGSMNDVVDDTTPQLGGNLDLNSNSLTSAAAFPITTGSSAGHDLTINTNQLVVEGDTGNVGIGSAAPTSALDLTGAITLQEIAAPAVSAAGDGRIYFDSTAKKFRVSENNGAYVDLVGGGGSMNDVVDDTTPQLGGQLDVNGQALGDGTLELMTFSETASAVNQLNVTNAATGNGPALSAAGDDTNIDLVLDGKGTGQVVLSSSDLNVTGNIVVSGTVDGIDIATDVAANTAKVTNATHTGDVTGSGALTIAPSAISGKTTVTAVATDMVLLWDATDSQLKKADANDFLGAGGSMNDVVDDTTPQLGGNLDLNSNSLTSAAAFPITTGSSAGHDLTVNTNQLVVEGDTGRVGIGTATPSQALDVVGNIAVSGTVDGIDIATDVAANTAKVTNATHTGDVTGSGALTIAPSAISGKTTVTAVATDMVLLWDATDSQLKKADVNDFIGGGGSMNDVVDDTTPQLGGNLDVNGNNFTSAAGMDFAIGGSAGNDFTVDTDKLVVEGDTGNAGIGTATPDYELEIYKAQNADTTLEIHNPNNTGSSEAQLLLNAGGSLGQIRKFSASSGSETLQMQNQENIQISAYGASSSILLDTNGGNRLTIDSSGNVGIGVTSPSTKIDVDGAINMQEMAAPAVSAAGDGRIYFDSTAKKFRVSENNGAYVDLVGSSGAAAIDGLTDGNTSWGTNSLLLGTTLANASITATDTIAIGSDSLNALTSGSNNISIGHGNLKAIDSDTNNLAIGHNSGAAMTSGSRTIIIGNDAFDAATNVNNSVVVGASAGGFAPGMQQSVAIGAYAMGYFSTGTPAEQVAVGYSALSQSEQSYNTAVGADSLQSLDQGFSNTAIGRQAGRAASGGDGSFNVFLGAQTGTAFTDADHNVFIGYRTGDTTTTGDNNILIGSDLDASTAIVSNELNIGALIHGTGLDATGTAIASGNIGIGVRPAQEKLEVAGGLALAEMTAPTTDVAGYHKLYVDTADNHLKYRNESGTVVNLSGGGGGSMNDVVDDTTPQLGGQLDVNGNAIGNGTEELIVFSETASAVNEITVTNAATGNDPSITASGGDTNIDLNLDGKGTGQVVLSSSDLNVTGNIIVSGTVDGIDIATDVAANTAKTSNATHTGDVTGSGALTIAPSAISGKTTVTAVATDMVLLWDATDSQLKKADVNDFMGGGGDIVNGGQAGAVSVGTTNDTNVSILQNGTTKLFFENSTGDIGFNTATPSRNFEIQSNEVVLRYVLGPTFVFDRTDATVNSDDVLGQLSFRSEDSGGELSLFGVHASETHSTGVGGAYMAFSTIANGTVTGSERMRIDNAGNVGIGTTTPGSKLEVSGDITADAYLFTSDARKKENVKTVKRALEKVLELRGVTFDWIASGEADIGLIAQEVEAVLPDLVNTNEDSGMKSVKYANLVAYLIEAIKEMQQEYDERISSLEKENEDLSNRVERLEALVEKLVQER